MNEEIDQIGSFDYVKTVTTSFISELRVFDIENLLKNIYKLFMIHLVLPLPPSVNKAYAGFLKRHKSNDYKKWEIQAREALKTQNKYTIAEDNWLSAMYVLHIDLHYKNWKKKVIDCWNYEKIVSDFLSGGNKPDKAIIPWFQDHKIIALSILKKQKTWPDDTIECCIDEILN